MGKVVTLDLQFGKEIHFRAKTYLWIQALFSFYFMCITTWCFPHMSAETNMHTHKLFGKLLQKTRLPHTHKIKLSILSEMNCWFNTLSYSSVCLEIINVTRSAKKGLKAFPNSQLHIFLSFKTITFILDQAIVLW